MLNNKKKLRLQFIIRKILDNDNGREMLKLLKEDLFISHIKASDKDLYMDEGRRRLVVYLEDIINSKNNNEE